MKKYIVLLVVILILVLFNISLISVKEIFTPTAYVIYENECEEQVPYEVQETYTEKEPYTHTYYEDASLEYVLENEETISCRGETKPLGVCLELIIRNKDDFDGVFQVTGYVERYDPVTNEFLGIEEKNQEQEIKAGDRKRFSLLFDIDVSDKWIYGYDVKVPSKSVKKEEIRYKDVKKTRTVTKYRTEIVPC